MEFRISQDLGLFPWGDGIDEEKVRNHHVNMVWRVHSQFDVIPFCKEWAAVESVVKEAEVWISVRACLSI